MPARITFVMPRLRDLEQFLDIVNRVVGLDVLANQSPGDALGAQEIDLRIEDDEGCVFAINLNVGLRELRVRVSCTEHEPDRDASYCVYFPRPFHCWPPSCPPR